MSEQEIKRIEKDMNKLVIDLDKNLNLKKELSQSENHLDFGCGYGIFTFMFSKHFPKLNILGTDINKGTIDIAKKMYSSRKLKFSTKLGGKFDSITVVHVLHEIKGDLNKNLEKIYSMLNKDGKIIIKDYKKTSKKEFRKLFEKKKSWGNGFEEEYAEHNRWTISEFKKIMEDAGFKTLKIKTYKKYWLMYLGKKA